RLVKQAPSSTWVAYPSSVSSTDPIRNVNTTTGLTDFGYHSLGDVANNAAMGDLTSPNGYFCSPSTLPIKVKIRNNGNNVLNSVRVEWSANGVPQTGYTDSTPIGIAGSPQGNEVEVTLGTYSFTNQNPVTFVFYTHSPNGQSDPAPVDDTLRISIRPGLSGTYTVGGATPDFPHAGGCHQ